MTGTPAWQQLWLDIPAHAAEQCEQAFLNAGALSVTLTELGNEPVLEPAPGENPLWKQTRITGLFSGETAPGLVFDRLQHNLNPAWLGGLGHAYLEDEDWVRKTQADFSAEKLGERCWVIPAWEALPDNLTNTDCPIRLDPGLAFGTGKHETTRLCLQWLERQSLQHQQWLDMGCGSGVLAIAAIRLGAAGATGVDIDPQALKASRDNAALNAISEQQLHLYLPEHDPQEHFDGLVANILAPTLIELAPALIERIKPDALFALSGILKDQAEAVAAAWTAAGGTVTTFEYSGDWALVAGHRQR